MKYLLFCLIAAFVLLPVSMAEARDPTLDFKEAHTENQDIYDWLSAKGFRFEQSAKNTRKTRLQATEAGMVMEALSPAQSILMFKKGHLTNYRNVEITWGVNKFPKGANYDKGRRNEAIMFYAFFGTEMIDSGSAFIPNSPYFLAIRLCETEDVGILHKGGYFHKGGRFVCVAHPKLGEVITTTFDLRSAFHDAFGFKAPPLSAIGLEFDTTGAGDGGKSSAIVEMISFPSATYIRD